ncbi:MAG TPA: hypothetical protein VIJ47_04655, partial [Acidimicrobiales bacterium]
MMVTVGGIQSVAAAATAPTFSISPDTSLPGGSIVFVVHGCAPTDTVIVSLSGVGVPTITVSSTDVDPQGVFYVGLVIPTTYPPGNYSGKAQCGETGDVATIGYTVSEQGTISLVITVGIDPNTCATATTLSVPAGTVVYYCDTIINHTN